MSAWGGGTWGEGGWGFTAFTSTVDDSATSTDAVAAIASVGAEVVETGTGSDEVLTLVQGNVVV
jgi:hypothetical protein